MTDLVTMQTLGTNGQWGNQIFQYCFLRTYAKRYGLDYAVPPWAGQHIFGFKDPDCRDFAPLPQVRERYEPFTHEDIFGVAVPPGPDDLRNKDYIGWAQFHTSWHQPDQPFIKGLFQEMRDPFASRLYPASKVLYARGRTAIGIHLRRSDAGRMIFFLTPIAWCLKWLHENWHRFDNPVVFLASEDHSLKRYFEHYGVLTSEDLGIVPEDSTPRGYVSPYTGWGGVDPAHFDFLPDWHFLSCCDVVLGAESSFSFTAAWLGACLEYWQPQMSSRGFVYHPLWNCRPIAGEHLDDFPGIPGTSLDANPIFDGYWKGYKNKYPAIPEDPAEIERWSKPPR
jgi:hypothetical protein